AGAILSARKAWGEVKAADDDMDTLGEVAISVEVGRMADAGGEEDQKHAITGRAEINRLGPEGASRRVLLRAVFWHHGAVSPHAKEVATGHAMTIVIEGEEGRRDLSHLDRAPRFRPIARPHHDARHTDFGLSRNQIIDLPR